MFTYISKQFSLGVSVLFQRITNMFYDVSEEFYFVCSLPLTHQNHVLVFIMNDDHFDR